MQEAVEWDRFTDAIGRAELRSDPRFKDLLSRRANAPSLVEILDAVFASKPLAYWRAELDRHTVTFGVIAQIDELPDDPQLNANGVFRVVEGSPGLGRSTVRCISTAPGSARQDARRNSASMEGRFCAGSAIRTRTSMRW